MELPYAELPEYPQSMTAGTVLSRMIDALAFRFRWATEALTAAEFEFKVGEGIFSIREATGHILFLADRINRTVGGALPEGAQVLTKVDGSSESGPPSSDAQELRRLILAHLASASARASALSAEELATCQIEIMPGRVFPIWNMINGPLADALTHVGQINSWRRMAGNPTPKANVFLGRAPKPTS